MSRLDPSLSFESAFLSGRLLVKRGHPSLQAHRKVPVLRLAILLRNSRSSLPLEIQLIRWHASLNGMVGGHESDDDVTQARSNRRSESAARDPLWTALLGRAELRLLSLWPRLQRAVRMLRFTAPLQCYATTSRRLAARVTDVESGPIVTGQRRPGAQPLRQIRI
jgi:hypothetical protein